ncbi:hypothetical protein PLESTF_001228000 [Pleodorina starrii]|nr:hypothetical protein PLESTF_001228000 [Pleodorina starrii]
MRLYGLTPDDTDAHVLHLVQLAARAGPSVAGGLHSADGGLLPGHCFTLSASAATDTGSPYLLSQSTHSSGYSWKADRGEAQQQQQQPLTLLEQALSSKTPAVFHFQGPTKTPPTGKPGAAANAGSPPAPAPPPPPVPLDCSAELGALHSSETVVFAAVPLLYGKRLLGALWMAVAADSSSGSAAAPSSQLRQAARSQALLGNGPALEQLGLSASMALALAASGDIEYVSWLSGCVRRLAGCTNLHTLVACVCSMLSKHVRLRFHADAAVQSALVPEPDSQVAFMLCPEINRLAGPANSGGGGGGSLGSCRQLKAHSSARDLLMSAHSSSWVNTAAAAAVQPGQGLVQHPRNSSGRPLKLLRRASSQTMLQKHDSGAAAAAAAAAAATAAAAAAAAGGKGATAPRGHTAMAAVGPQTAPGAFLHGPLLTSPFTTAPADSLGSEREALEGSSTPRTARFLAAAGAGGPASAMLSLPVLFMSAKAFQLSHTLLSRLVGGARKRQPAVEQQQVPTGIIVADTARHMADVRQPSRDVCMLIGSKGAVTGTIWQQQQQPGGSGSIGSAGMGIHTVLDQSGGRSGPASLLLLAMEVAEGGCMLGLYVAFPTLMPQPLLVAARDSCEQLLRQVGREPGTGPDLDTLRAGVPGSYVSVSRVRDHVDRLQPPMDSLGAGPAAAAATAAATASERLVPQPQVPTPRQDLEAALSQRMAAWNAQGSRQGQGGCGLGSPAHGQSGGSGQKASGGGGGVGKEIEAPPPAAISPTLSRSRLTQGSLRTPSLTAEPVATAATARASSLLLDSPSPGGAEAQDTGASDKEGGAPRAAYAAANLIFARSSWAAGAAPASPSSHLAPTTSAASGPAAACLEVAAEPSSTGTQHIGGGGGGLLMTYNACLVRSGGGPSCGGNMGSAGGGCASPVMLDSNAEGACHQEGQFTHQQQAALMTVHGVDDTVGMRGMMGALVESIMTTLRVSASEVAELSSHGGDLAHTRAVEGLDDLHLSEVLGHGASGVVLRGTLGTVPVAVKLMEMPDVDQDSDHEDGQDGDQDGELSAAAPREHKAEGASRSRDHSRRCRHHQQLQQPQPLTMLTLEEPLVKSLTSMAATGSSGASAELMRAAGIQQDLTPPPHRQQQQVRGKQEPQHPQQQQEQEQAHCGDSRRNWPWRQQQRTESEEMRARRNMLRNAMELAVMRLVSHVCIVQAFAVYDNVYLERLPAASSAAGDIILRRLGPHHKEDTGGSPICTAIVQELCDCGTLADVLADRNFPALVISAGGGSASTSGSKGAHPHPSGTRRGRAAAAADCGRKEIDMRGVYLTLLEIALALKHLHSRRLVHRDVKPANILLKSSPGDPRGWTCKLADFGFALVLDQQDKVADAKDECNKPPQSPGGGLPLFLPGTGTGTGSFSSGSNGAGGRTWFTIQAQASGTVTHMAPEAVLKNSRIDASVDIFALGIIFWELVCGRGQRPYRHLEPAAIPAAVVAGLRPVFGADVPAPYRKMAQACWAQEPHRRPRAADVVSFIKSQLAGMTTD